ncbi:hypothetical protein [Vineibacter terrae]|uniref:hypothetical protein n=1 Tax=Vineibacter terrae TaxID=2586908 RepID=UPI0015B71372|nr:hypothetical protein [Vineibacter terrae]
MPANGLADGCCILDASYVVLVDRQAADRARDAYAEASAGPTKNEPIWERIAVGLC